MTINFTGKPQPQNNNTQPSIYHRAKQLYTDVANGERPTFDYDINQDPNMLSLEQLAENYKQTRSIEAKKSLLNHERTILYEELEHPELTLARNYGKIIWLDDVIGSRNKPKLDNTLEYFNIMGLRRIEKLNGPFKTNGEGSKLDTLKKVYKSTDENTNFGTQVKNIIIQTTLNFQKMGIMAKEKINETMSFYFQNTKNKDLKSTILEGIESPDNTKIINDLKINHNQEDKLKFLMLKANKNEHKDATNIVNNILQDKKAKPEIKRLAVWGAGKFRSEEGFSFIKEIALNAKEKDVRLREFAIHSTALYLRERPEEVKNIMQQISKEGSIFEPLGKVMNDKVNGTYHGQIDREFNYQNFTKKDKDLLKVLSNWIIPSNTKLNRQKQNAYDRTVVSFQNIIPDLVNENHKVYRLEDTYTQIHPSVSGKRVFGQRIETCGDFFDSNDGGNTEKYSMINISHLGTSEKYGVASHELGHATHRMFANLGQETQERLYQDAKQTNKILDYYAALNPDENFAQGCEAMASIYKPHSILLQTDGANHTRYELMAKDKNLFKFIELNLRKIH